MTPSAPQPAASANLAPPARPTRRGLLRRAFGSAFALGTWAAGLTGALWTLATGRFFMPNVLAEPPRRLRVGPPGQYPPGRVEIRYKESHGLWIVHGPYRGQWQIYALRTACTHLGCITLWQEGEQKFKCPCHGSGFSMSGLNLEGPAPRALERYAIQLAADGRLEVDTGRTFREELGQWRDAASFVVV